MSQRLEDIHRDVRGQPSAELGKLRAENGELKQTCAELQAKVGGIERLLGGSAIPVVDLTSDDGANFTPTPKKRSALSRVAEEREESDRLLKKVKVERDDAKDELEDAQELAGDLHKSENSKMSIIDGLEARIRELERGA